MKQTLLTICLIVFALLSWGGTKNTIKIPTHNWSSQVVGAYVLGGIFERLGEKVEYIPSDSQSVYNLLSNGQVDIVHEIWEEAFDKSFQVSLKTGNVIDLYTYNFPSIEGWWYPSYLEEKCPSLVDWSVLITYSSYLLNNQH